MLSMTRYSIKNERLTPLVKFIWRFEAENASIHHKLLPTDSIDIVMNLSGDITYEMDSDMFTAPPFHVNGLRNRCSYIRQTGAIHVWGISFYSFGLFPFIRKSIKDIQNEIVDLYSLSPSLERKLYAAVSSGAAQETVGRIEAALLLELDVRDDYSRLSLISDFINTGDAVTIQAFCEERGINIKTFERMVSRYTGSAPKKLRRIRRFQAACNQMIYQRPADLIGVTYDHNFADQAHFTKDFREFSGASPGTFLREKATIKENARYNYF